MRRTVNERASLVRDENGIALMSAILFMMLLGGLSLVLLSIVLGQAAPAYLAQKSTKTVNAAQAGLQAALGIVRSVNGAVVAGQTYGSRADLPCTVDGSVDGNTADLKYTVNVSYFTSDPTGRDTAWMNLNKLVCNAAGVASQPTFAYFKSEGKGAAITGRAANYGDRSVSAVYKFQITVVNIPGGPIYDSTAGWCLEATSIAVNAEIKFVRASTCTDANKAKQSWIYDSDYEIKLASTTVAPATPLCITGPIAPAGESNAVLKPCLARSDPARWNQLWNWSWSGTARWIGTNSTNTNWGSYCLGSTGAANLTDTRLRIGGCGGQLFAPTPAVGAGAASILTQQIVNFKEFGRCADVTDEKIGSANMISYPCKQDPTEGRAPTDRRVKWNHKWVYQEPPSGSPSLGNQQIVVTLEDGTPYCLQTRAGSATQAYPKFELCSASADQRWTRFYLTGDPNTAYTFRDARNRCMSIEPVAGSWSKITVATCTGLDNQKWNAPSTYNRATFGSYSESSG